MATKLPRKPFFHYIFALVVAGIAILAITTWGVDTYITLQQRVSGTEKEKVNLEAQIASISAELTSLKNEDQYKRNNELQKTIREIESMFTQAVAAYEDLLGLREVSKTTGKFDDRFAKILTTLAKRDYATAGKDIITFRADIKTERDRIASTFVIPANVPVSNAAPAAGASSQQSVQADIGTYLVSVVAADLGSTHVYVDTASSGTCGNDCPVMSLAAYAARNGAFAGINGSYFCPASYPSCAGKTNSFDTLLMNKNKVYFNSDNNVYSTVPAVIFGNGWVRFVGASQEWGRDTGIDSMIANQPLLLSGGNITFGGGSDPKQGSKGSRSFVANKGNTVYIGVVFNATVAEVAHVLKAMGMENALNLDSGGSTALWSGGYKVGPGRDIPNAILFVRK